MKMKKIITHSIVFCFILILAGLSFYFKDHILNTNKPIKSAEYFLSTLEDIELNKNKLAKSDLIALSELEIDYLKEKNIDKSISSFDLKEETKISETNQKLVFTTDKGDIELDLILEQDEWKVFLNLDPIVKIQQIKNAIENAELREDKLEQVLFLQQLQEKTPEDKSIESKIKSLEVAIALENKLKEYISYIDVTDVVIKGKTLIANIKNMGDENIKKIVGDLIVIDPKDGSILKEIPLTIYEIIEGSLVYGEPIMPQFMKTIGLDITEVPEIKNAKMVSFKIKEVEFFKPNE